MEFYNLKVVDVEKETTDCVSVRLEVPVDLRHQFAFIPGQYLTFQQQIGDVVIRRSYSICSFGQEGLRVAIKRVDGGLFSSWANDHLEKDMNLQVAPPEGNFIHNPVTGSHIYVAFVAGSGITPVMSMMKSILAKEPLSQFILFYGNKTIQQIIFKEEIESLKNKYMERLQIYHILSREKTDAPIFSSRIDPANCDRYFKYFVGTTEVEELFLCGPLEMIQGMKKAIVDLGIDESRIKFELFYNPEADDSGKIEKENVKLNESRTVVITLDGITSEVDTAYDISILDMAVDAGLDLPYSCKGGVCATCKARVVKGKVEMVSNFALEKEEVAAGYVLTCQSHIKSANAEVNFDI